MHPAVSALCAASDYSAGDYDIDLYHLGNNPTFHSYMFQPLLHRPGVVVLHDPAIADFVEVLFGGRMASDLRSRGRLQLGQSRSATIGVAGGHRLWDRTELLMSRRVVESSIITLVHSAWAARYLCERFGATNVHEVPFAVQIDSGRLHSRSGRRPSLLASLATSVSTSACPRWCTRSRRPAARGSTPISSLPDDVTVAEAEARVRELIDESDFADAVVFAVDVDQSDFRTFQEECDVIIGLRWPTAGETSASLLECFALAKSAIVSDVPQMSQFNDEYCVKREHGPGQRTR